MEAYCTEGPLDLLSRGFAQTMRVEDRDDDFILTYDQVFATEACANTVVQRAVKPSESRPTWQMQELSRVPVPATRECFGTPEADRPGEVRMIGDRLEVLVQRSQWCRGFEVRMVYEAARPELLTHEEIIRRYVAYFGLGNATGRIDLEAEWMTAAAEEDAVLADFVRRARDPWSTWIEEGVRNLGTDLQELGCNPPPAGATATARR